MAKKADETTADINAILKTADANGGPFWSRADGNIHAPSGFSTIDVLSTLGELGVRATRSLPAAEAVDFVFTYFDGSGCFRYAPGSARLPCITAQVLIALGKLGIKSDQRVEKCYEHLLAAQQLDGGWRCGTVKLGKSPETDASNPGTTLYALDAFRFRKNSPGDAKKLDRAVKFLLAHWETRLPLGPCAFGIGSRFLSIEYPFLRYNLFYYVYALSKYPSALKDRRFSRARQALLDKTHGDVLCPETPHQAWSAFRFARKGSPSGPGTKRLLEIKGG